MVLINEIRIKLNLLMNMRGSGDYCEYTQNRIIQYSSWNEYVILFKTHNASGSDAYPISSNLYDAILSRNARVDSLDATTNNLVAFVQNGFGRTMLHIATLITIDTLIKDDDITMLQYNK